ncbi:MAG TPA: hypothetical protein VJ949_05055 [Cryomorphaceae bacterium]|nr:hypothetical protein [Cryomorphaceae bacterium]
MKILPVSNQFPDSFYEVSDAIYADLPYAPEEDRAQIEALLQMQRDKFDLYLITDSENVRLLVICPKEGRTAYFGYWETKNDLSLCRKAFEQFEGLAAEKGFENLQGPIHFNTFHRYRLRLQTPSWKMFDREPVNPSYYPEFLENLGFSVLHRYESRLIRPEVVADVYQDKKAFLESVRDLPVEFIPLTEETWLARETEIFELINAVFGFNPGFQSISMEEFRLLYNADFAARLCPHTSVLVAERNSGKLIALSLCQPNYTSLNLTEKPLFEKHYPLLKHRTMLAKTQGVHPQYREQGLMNYLGAYGMLSFKKYYDDSIFCLMRDDNPSLRFTDPVDYEKAEYALYTKAL